MMNSTECTVVQRLIADLDNTRVVYAKLGPLLIRPHLRYLVERITASHTAIADDLAGQVHRKAGSVARRGGGVRAKVRARIESWIAVSHVDVEFGCLKRIASHEVRVTRRFRGTLAAVRCLHQNLHREARQLERDLFRIDSLMREMAPPSLELRPPATITPFAHDERSRS